MDQKLKIETGNSKEAQLYKMKEVKEVTNYAKNMPRNWQNSKVSFKAYAKEETNQEIIPDMKH